MGRRRTAPGYPVAGRRPLACYHEAGHCLARWFFGHTADRAVVLTVEEVVAGAWPVDRKGRVTQCEGVTEGHDIGPSEFLLGPSALSCLPPSQRAEIERSLVMGTDVCLVDCAIGIAAEARFTGQPDALSLLVGGSEDIAHAARLARLRFPDPEAVGGALERCTAWAHILIASEAGWAAVTRIADALQTKGVVEWGEVDEFCMSAYGHAAVHSGEWLHAWPPTAEMLQGRQSPSRQPGPSVDHADHHGVAGMTR